MEQIKHKNRNTKDGGGVNGSHTDLLPGPIWNYKSIVEKPPGTNNREIAREKHITSDIQN